MNAFLQATFSRQKFQGLFVNTALGNFAAYVAGSLVTLVSTRHVLERRGITNLFGVLHRKKVVVHVLPHWLEWLSALIVGFLVMEAVRYWLNPHRYSALLSASGPNVVIDRDGHAGDPPGSAVRCASDNGGCKAVPKPTHE